MAACIFQGPYRQAKHKQPRPEFELGSQNSLSVVTNAEYSKVVGQYLIRHQRVKKFSQRIIVVTKPIDSVTLP